MNEKRISKDDYKRPKHTIQDKMTEEEIDEKLEDYIEIEDIFKVPLNSHIRYYTLIPGKDGEIKKAFRLGGQLKNKDNWYLQSNRNNWQLHCHSISLFRTLLE